ncbi:unnamed protein product, partial [Brassica oleracea]
LALILDQNQRQSTFDGQVSNDNSGNDIPVSGAVKKTYTADGVKFKQLCRSEHRWHRY